MHNRLLFKPRLADQGFNRHGQARIGNVIMQQEVAAAGLQPLALALPCNVEDVPDEAREI